MTATTEPGTGLGLVTQARPVPPLGPPRRGRAPSTAERVLASGLRVVAVRRPGVPLVEVRLRVPFAGRDDAHLPRASLLSQTMLNGTATMSTVEIAATLQELGGSLAVGTTPDRLQVGGSCLAAGLPRLLEVLAEVLVGASYPKDEVTGERDRLVERLKIALSQPGVLAREAMLRRLYGRHPYHREIPAPEELAEVTPARLRTLHRNQVVPAGSVLVLVGDLSTGRALDAVDRALSGWDRSGRARGAPDVPPLEPGPVVLVDRPGAVQSNIRVGGPAVRRGDESYPAMQLANMVFGGYFSSRLVENIREDKGYTYSPHSMIDHAAAGSAVMVDADVATEVTAPALLEIRYELGRIATLPVGADELDDARRYAIGSLALATSSQGGLASMLASLLANGLSPQWLRDHPRRLAKVTVEDVREQAGRFLAPSRLATVVVGDAVVIEPPLSKLDEVAPG